MKKYGLQDALTAVVRGSIDFVVPQEQADEILKPFRAKMLAEGQAPIKSKENIIYRTRTAKPQIAIQCANARELSSLKKELEFLGIIPEETHSDDKGHRLYIAAKSTVDGKISIECPKEKGLEVVELLGLDSKVAKAEKGGLVFEPKYVPLSTDGQTFRHARGNLNTVPDDNASESLKTHLRTYRSTVADLRQKISEAEDEKMWTQINATQTSKGANKLQNDIAPINAQIEQINSEIIEQRANARASLDLSQPGSVPMPSLEEAAAASSPSRDSSIAEVLTPIATVTYANTGVAMRETLMATASRQAAQPLVEGDASLENKKMIIEKFGTSRVKEVFMKNSEYGNSVCVAFRDEDRALEASAFLGNNGLKNEAKTTNKQPRSVRGNDQKHRENVLMFGIETQMPILRSIPAMQPLQQRKILGAAAGRS